MGSLSILLFEKLNDFNDVKFLIEVGIYVIKFDDIVNVSKCVNSPIKDGMKVI